MFVERKNRLASFACRGSLTILLSCALASAAHAQLLAYDGFDYATGGLVDVGGGALGSGTGWVTATQNPDLHGWYYESLGGTPNPIGTVVDAAPSDWEYTDSQGNKLVTTGGRVEYANYQAYVRQVDLSGLPANQLKNTTAGREELGVDGSQLWISFLGQGTEIQSTATIDYGGVHDVDEHLGFQRAGGLGRPWMLQEDGTQGSGTPNSDRNTAWGVIDFTPSIDPLAATGDSYDEKVFFVARIDFGAGASLPGGIAGDEAISVWTNPDLGSTAPSDADRKISDFLQWDFDFGAIRLGGNANTFYDEIRIGMTYADVAPIAAPSGGGDFDGNEVVDGADFLKWQREFGAPYTASDLADWRSGYDGTSAQVATSAVPEPGAFAILSTLALTLTLRRRKN